MTARIRNWLSLLVPLLASVLLSSCGGGGGGDGSGSGDAFSLSATSVTFSATQGQPTPPAQVVTVTVLRGTVFFLVQQSGGGGYSQNFQITGQTTGTITITPISTINAGNFSGTITVFGCSNQTGPSCAHVAGSPKTINVTYNIAAAPTLSANPPTVDFVTTTGTLPGSKQVTLTLSSGSSPLSIGPIQYGSPPTGWLSVTAGTGNLNPSDTATFNVTDASSFGVRQATVTFTATNGGQSRIVPVTLTINDPQVNFVAPYVTAPLASHNVIIRGSGFSALSPSTLQVTFGGTPASGVTRISDTEIQATLPGTLTPGSYAISVTDGSITIPSRSQLKLLVQNAPGFVAANVVRSTSSAVGNLIFDAERQALYLMDPDNKRIERYTASGVVWGFNGTFTVGGFPINNRIALTPDGTELLATGNGIIRIDPVLLQVIQGIPATIGGQPLTLNMIAMANDGGAIGNCTSPSGITLYRYDALTTQFTALSTQSDMTNRQIVASGDGDTIAMPTFESLILSAAKPVFILDASAGALAQAAQSTTSSELVAVSRSGSRIIMRTLQSDSASDVVAKVYDYAGNGGALTLRGSLPPGDSGFTISPDGNTAYVYYSSSPEVRKFDLTGLGPSFTQTGFVSIAATPPGAGSAVMTINPHGDTLFLAGNQRVVIVPAP